MSEAQVLVYLTLLAALALAAMAANDDDDYSI
jgi:hypothetical protein